MSPARLKAFVLNLGDGPDLDRPATFWRPLGLVAVSRSDCGATRGPRSSRETLRVIEDYKPLDVECAAMGLALCRGIRARYPDGSTWSTATAATRT